MKKILLLITIVIAAAFINEASAQTDTVCVNSSTVPYSVTSTAGSTYAWTISGGGTLSASTGNAISVNWASTPGLYTLQVTETSASGCVGDPVSLNVRVLPLPTASIAGNTTMCFNDGAPTVTVSLTGEGPWTFTFSNGTTTNTVTNHNSSTYTFSAAPTIPAAGTSAATTTYTLTSVNNRFCSGTTSGSAAVTVNPKPVTSGIIY
ncbi:MAG: hypothetical protein ACK45U_00665 [bacterium]